jgi:ABC-type nickel/cobalt efflux system permease component RcnA
MPARIAVGEILIEGIREVHSINFISIIALGFFLGMRHATDPDHVIAVTTIVSRYRKVSHAAWIGILWGCGHTLTILLVGGGIILFGWVIPARIGLSMEFSVGLMLVLLGFLNLTGVLQWINRNVSAFTGSLEHEHVHRHGDLVHSHSHSHDSQNKPLEWGDSKFSEIGFYRLVRPLIVGLVHGLAGSAAVALLVLTTIRDPRWAIAYLLVFGIGTIAGMMLITAAIAAPFIYSSKRFSNIGHVMRVASGVISVAFGLFVIYEIGFVNGLFTSHPHWTPR